jgi:hypothetical protein
MIEPTTIPENIMYCTTRIIAQPEISGQPIKAGTAFFFHFTAKDDKVVPVLVTNKHVVEGCTSAGIVVHTIATSGKKPMGNQPIQFSARLGAEWIPHSDDKIDLCAYPVGPLFNSMNPGPFYRALDKSIIPSQTDLESLDAVEDLLMAGYPNGLWDEVNNYHLIRRGITSSHPGVDFMVNGVATTVADIAVFPGSSGSPVFVFNKSGYADKRGTLSIGAARVMFIGVLYSGPVIQNDGTIVIRNIPTAQEPIPRITTPMNLGYVMKARELPALGKAVFKRLGIEE